ncbi:MAG: hypothetical protein AB7T49_05065 [Oligoflexales bacterium]
MKLLLIFLILANVGCKERASSSASSETNSSNLPLPCPGGGSTQAFTLGKMNPMPSESVVDYGAANMGDVYELKPAEPGGYRVRLDVCIDEVNESVVLMRFLYQMFPGDRTEVMTVDESISEPKEVSFKNYLIPRSFVSDQGLKEAVFGEPKHLKVTVKYEDGYGYLVNGWQDGNTQFATAVNGYVNDGLMHVSSRWLIAGAFEPGDPFKDGPCKDGQYAGSANFTLGTAKFTMDSCLFPGGGETTGFEVKKLTVEDSNPALTAEQRKPFSFEKESLESVFKYNWDHHNACDSFVLTLPHGTYSATTAANAGCGSILEGAPARTYEDGRRTTLFRIKYGTQTPVEGELDCLHFHFCNEGLGG